MDKPLGTGGQATVYKISPTAQSKATSARALKVVPFVDVEAKGARLDPFCVTFSSRFQLFSSRLALIFGDNWSKQASSSAKQSS